MKSLDEQMNTLMRFVGQDVRVQLSAPSGRRVILPLDQVRVVDNEIFYLSSQGHIINASQLTETSMIASREKVTPVLLFNLGIKSHSNKNHRKYQE